MERKLRDITLFLICAIVLFAFLLGSYSIGKDVFHWAGPSSSINRLGESILALCFGGVLFLTVFNLALNLGIIARSLETISARAKLGEPPLPNEAISNAPAHWGRKVIGVTIIAFLLIGLVWGAGSAMDYRQYYQREADVVTTLESVPDTAPQIRKLATLIHDNGSTKEISASLTELAGIMNISKSELSIVIPMKDETNAIAWYTRATSVVPVCNDNEISTPLSSSDPYILRNMEEKQKLDKMAAGKLQNFSVLYEESYPNPIKVYSRRESGGEWFALVITTERNKTSHYILD